MGQRCVGVCGRCQFATSPTLSAALFASKGSKHTWPEARATNIYPWVGGVQNEWSSIVTISVQFSGFVLPDFETLKSLSTLQYVRDTDRPERTHQGCECEWDWLRQVCIGLGANTPLFISHSKHVTKKPSHSNHTWVTVTIIKTSLTCLSKTEMGR